MAKNQIYQPIHPNTDLPHPTRDQEDLSLLIFVKMSQNKSANCPKNMYNIPNNMGMLPKFTDTLIQMGTIFLGNMPMFLGQLTLIKLVFYLKSYFRIR